MNAECEAKCSKLRMVFAPIHILSIYRRKYDCCVSSCMKTPCKPTNYSEQSSSLSLGMSETTPALLRLIPAHPRNSPTQ